MKKQMEIRFPCQDTQNIIVSLLFLRVICPVVINPGLINSMLISTWPPAVTTIFY